MRAIYAFLAITGLVTHTVQCAPAPDTMFAHYIDVGQAAATLLEFPTGAILIDAGSQDDQRTLSLVDYLDRFFDDRPHLNRTISTIFITHTHVDHTRALREVAEGFTVKNFVHSGLLSGFAPADTDVKWVMSNAPNRNIHLFDVDNEDMTVTGFSNGQIDAVTGSVDPEIRVFSAEFRDNPGWSQNEFKDENNHSVVIRVRFGVASFLFTGDLEEPAIKELLDRYQGSDVLDVDVFQVGHHGSYNGTTDSLLVAVKPLIAVIPMGSSTERVPFSAWAHGHPRDVAIDRLKKAIRRTRRSKTVSVATTVKTFKNVTMRDAIYGTGWDGTVLVRATSDGKYRVMTER